MTILGIGNDILEITRIRESIETYGSRFLNKIFTPSEQRYCAKFKDSIPHYAARFSAKESISKVFGTGIGKTISWLDMEILNDLQGKPEVHFSKKIQEYFESPKVLLTISHSRDYVSTFAIWISNSHP